MIVPDDEWASGSSWQTFGSPTSYQARAYTTNTGSTAYGGVHVKRTTGASSPTGQLGADAGLVRGTALCSFTNAVYNGSPVILHIVTVSGNCGAGNYRTSGTGLGYQASGSYSLKAIPWTPYQTVP